MTSLEAGAAPAVLRQRREPRWPLAGRARRHGARASPSFGKMQPALGGKRPPGDDKSDSVRSGEGVGVDYPEVNAADALCIGSEALLVAGNGNLGADADVEPPASSRSVTERRVSGR